jgi:hypothetical protein
MSASKEGFTPAALGGRGWADVSPSRRCPVCGGSSWCQIARDTSETVLCKRVGNGRRPRSNRDGVEFYTHHLGARRWTAPAEAPAPATTRASADDCDHAYRVVLATLRLDDDDRAGLRARGLDDAAIAANGYRTLPLEGRARVARAVVQAVGEHVARAVPGVAWKTGDDERGWWTLAGAPGLLIPERDLDGRIAALKVRRRDVEPGQQRYLYLSSASRGGASAASAVHVPVAAQSMRGVPLVVTEGPLKADVSTHLLGSRPVVSLPGVGSWALALDVVEAWGARDVAVAFDADARTNRHVQRALVNLVDGLRAAGCRVEVWRWEGPAKGLDDHLHAQLRDEEATE